MITVITPTIFGRHDLLEACKESVNKQTVPVEHLVAVDRWQRGPAHIRNQLARQAETEWLLPVDDDDLIDPECAETLLWNSRDADIVIPWCRVSDEGEMEPWSPNRLFWPDTLIVHNYVPVTALIRRELWESVGGQPEGVQHEDWRFWKKCLAAGARFRVLPEVLWTYRRFAGSRNEWKETA